MKKKTSLFIFHFLFAGLILGLAACTQLSFPIKDFSRFDAITLQQGEQNLHLFKEKETWLLQVQNQKHSVAITALNALFAQLSDLQILHSSDSACENPTILQFWQKGELRVQYAFTQVAERICLSYQIDAAQQQNYWTVPSLSLENFSSAFSLAVDHWVSPTLLTLDVEHLEKIHLEYPKEQENILLLRKADGFSLQTQANTILPFVPELQAAYLAFYRHIQHAGLVLEDFDQNYRIDSTQFYAKASIQTPTQRHHFVFYPMYYLNAGKHPYLCVGFYNDTPYLFNYFHIDLFLKTASFFTTYSQSVYAIP